MSETDTELETEAASEPPTPPRDDRDPWETTHDSTPSPESAASEPAASEPPTDSPDDTDAGWLERIDDKTGGIFKAVLPLLIIIGGIVGYKIFGQAPEMGKRTDDGDGSIPVEVVAAKPVAEKFPIVIDGVVKPHDEISLAAQVSGRITKKFEASEAGSNVEPGTELLNIDPQDYKLERQRLESQLLQKESELAELQQEIVNTGNLLKIAKNDQTLRQNEVRRIVRAYQNNSISESEKDRVLREELLAQNSVATLENQKALLEKREKTLDAGIKLVERQIERARLDEDRAIIKSPLRGVVVTSSVEEGDFVQMGSPLLSIEATEAVEVHCQLSLEELSWIWTQDDRGSSPETALTGQSYRLPPIEVTISHEVAGEDLEWTGTLFQFDGAGLDERTRLVPIRILVETPERKRSLGEAAEMFGPTKLLRNMYVTVEIPIESKSELVRIPERALQPGGQVWIARDGKLAIRKVAIVHSENDWVWLRTTEDSIRADDRVIVSPIPFPVEGAKLKPDEIRIPEPKPDESSTGSP